jgi:hypothetical protein
MASMAELARQLLGMNGNSVGGVSPDRYMEIMDRSPYGTGVPLEIGYGEQDQMSPLDAAAMVTGGVPVVGDLTGLAADVDMYMRDPESRNIPNYLLTAAGVLPFLPAASQVRQGIRAYHGSPYNFPPVRELEMPDGAVVYQSMDDVVPEGAQVIAEHPLGRFDMSKIGTGEGAQAYGQGLYFAESEDVARGYREALASRKPSPTHKGRGYDELEGPEYRALSAIEREVRYNKKLSPKEAKEVAITSLKQQKKRAAENIDPAIREERLKDYDEDLAALESMSPDDIVIGGSMYEVNIDANPDELLDWDLPLSKQSDFVREKLQALGDADNKKAVGEYDDALLDALFNDSNKALPKQPVDLSGKHLYYRSAPDATDPADASKALKDIGIKGIRYKDGFSRGTDGGTSNYVIFDDRLISIAKKYGIAIPAAAAYLARMTGEDTSQSYQEAS